MDRARLPKAGHNDGKATLLNVIGMCSATRGLPQETLQRPAEKNIQARTEQDAGVDIMACRGEIFGPIVA